MKSIKKLPHTKRVYKKKKRGGSQHYWTGRKSTKSKNSSHRIILWLRSDETWVVNHHSNRGRGIYLHHIHKDTRSFPKRNQAEEYGINIFNKLDKGKNYIELHSPERHPYGLDRTSKRWWAVRQENEKIKLNGISQRRFNNLRKSQGKVQYYNGCHSKKRARTSLGITNIVQTYKVPRVDLKKLDAHFIRAAKKNKAWAKRTAKDKRWMRQASIISTEMLQERLTKPIEELARGSRDYMILRANAKGRGWGGGWIDPTAREEYKKITGHYPKTKLR